MAILHEFHDGKEIRKDGDAQLFGARTAYRHGRTPPAQQDVDADQLWRTIGESREVVVASEGVDVVALARQ